MSLGQPRSRAAFALPAQQPVRHRIAQQRRRRLGGVGRVVAGVAAAKALAQDFGVEAAIASRRLGPRRSCGRHDVRVAFGPLNRASLAVALTQQARSLVGVGIVEGGFGGRGGAGMGAINIVTTGSSGAVVVRAVAMRPTLGAGGFAGENEVGVCRRIGRRGRIMRFSQLAGYLWCMLVVGRSCRRWAARRGV